MTAAPLYHRLHGSLVVTYRTGPLSFKRLDNDTEATQAPGWSWWALQPAGGRWRRLSAPQLYASEQEALAGAALSLKPPQPMRKQP